MMVGFHNINRVDMERHIVVTLLVFWGLLGVVSPQFTPYLFLCNYHGGLDQGDLSQGEIALSVAIEGNPNYYVPGHMYQGRYSGFC